MAKSRIEFLCRECGSSQPKWQGKCPDCGAWDSLEKFTVEADPERSTAPIWGAPDAAGDADELARAGIGRAVALGSVPEAEVPRVPSGIGELDRVLGGGIVPGSVMLLGGDPGIGKSTLLMQAAASVAARGGTALYASSEESPQQVRLRAERLDAVRTAAPRRSVSACASSARRASAASSRRRAAPARPSSSSTRSSSSTAPTSRRPPVRSPSSAAAASTSSRSRSRPAAA